MEQFERCPQLWLFKKKNIRPDYVGSAAIVGRLVHDFIHRYTLACWDSGYSKHGENGNEIRRQMMVEMDPQYHSDFEWLAIRSIDHLEFGARPAIGGAELQLSLGPDLKPCEWDDALVRGIIDFCRVQDFLVSVTDYKSGFGIIAPSAVKDSWQLRMYAYMLARHFQDEKASAITIRLLYLRHFLTRDYTERQATFSTDELRVIHNQIVDRMKLVARIWSGKEDAECRHGDHCENCFCSDLCPWRKKYAEEARPVVTKEDAIERLHFVAALKGAVSRMEKPLKDWVKVNGPVGGVKITTVKSPIYNEEAWKKLNPKTWMEAYQFSPKLAEKMGKNKFEQLKEQSELEGSSRITVTAKATT